MASLSALAEVSKDGAFVRTASSFREVIGSDAYPAASGRYHLYICHACPWAHRAMMARAMKGLEDVISVSVVHPTWQRTRPEDPADLHCGWAFRPEGGPSVIGPAGHGEFGCEGCTADPFGASFVRDIYDKVGYDGKKFTVPILFDKESMTIVNNESSEIIRMLNSAFNEFCDEARVPGARSRDLYPEALRAPIDEVNEWVYHSVNNGVYKCGFAQSQSAYAAAADALFEGLDRLEEILSRQRYLCGDAFTEADLRAFPTLVRFDEVYVVYFKTNRARIADYPNLWNYVREIYQMPGVAATVNMNHIKTHYFTSHPSLNPYAIIPTGPGVEAELAKPHNRNELFPTPK